MTTAVPHPRHRLSETLHQPVRFSIAAALAATESMDFGTLRDRIQVTDSALSKQLTILQAAGLIQVKKGFVGKRPRTWLSLTAAGSEAWRGHLATLQEIASSR